MDRETPIRATRDYPVNQAPQPVPCGNKTYRQGMYAYQCDLPMGHIGMHAQGIILWENKEN